MKFAIPTANRMLCSHFRYCEDFTVMRVDDKNGIITSVYNEVPPLNKPWMVVKWLNNKGIDVIIADKISMWERYLFAMKNIKVIAGVSANKPVEIVYSYLDNTLAAGNNDCFYRCRC